MILITLEEKKRLEEIRKYFSNTSYWGAAEKDGWTIYSFCLYGKDEEVTPYLYTPDEWIRGAYPSVKSYSRYRF